MSIIYDRDPFGRGFLGKKGAFGSVRKYFYMGKRSIRDESES